MKKQHYILMAAFTGLLLLCSIIPQTIQAYSTVPPSGRTGSPGDGQTCTSCHGGNPIILQDGLVSDIPAEGYIPGESYTIKITDNFSIDDKTRYGFQLSPQNLNGELIGSLEQTNGTNLSTDNKYISHNGAIMGNPDWEFTWNAPAEGTGDVTFYLAVLGAKDGQYKVTNLAQSFPENNSLNTTRIEKIENLIVANNQVQILDEGIERAEIFNTNGQLIDLKILNNTENVTFETYGWKKGMYIVRVKSNDSWKSSKFILN